MRNEGGPTSLPEAHTHTAASPSGRLQLPNLSGLNSPLSGTPLASPRRETPRAPSSPSVSHRSSFAENLRGFPSSPRQRNPSFSQQALQDLINNPPVARNSPAGDKYQDRDWRSIQVGEIISAEDVRFVETDTSVEATTKVPPGRSTWLQSHSLTRHTASHRIGSSQCRASTSRQVDTPGDRRL